MSSHAVPSHPALPCPVLPCPSLPVNKKQQGRMLTVGDMLGARNINYMEPRSFWAQSSCFCEATTQGETDDVVSETTNTRVLTDYLVGR